MMKTMAPSSPIDQDMSKRQYFSRPEVLSPIGQQESRRISLANSFLPNNQASCRIANISLPPLVLRDSRPATPTTSTPTMKDARRDSLLEPSPSPSPDSVRSRKISTSSSCSSGVHFSFDSDEFEHDQKSFESVYQPRHRSHSVPFRTIAPDDCVLSPFDVNYIEQTQEYDEVWSLNSGAQDLNTRSGHHSNPQSVGNTFQSHSPKSLSRSRSYTDAEKRARRESFRISTLKQYQECFEHKYGRLALYCEDCMKPMCFKCKLTGHTGHNCTTIGSAATRRRASVRRIRNGLDEKMGTFQNLQHKFQQYDDDLDLKHNFLVEQINTRAEDLHNIVNQWHSQTALKLESIWKVEQDHIKTRLSEIETTLNDIRDACDHIDHVIDYKHPNDFLTHSKEIKTRMQELERENSDGLESRLCAVFTSSMDLTPEMFGKLSVQRLDNDNISGSLQHITRGREIYSFNSRPTDAVCRYKASGVSLMPSGDILVTDIGMDQAQLFTTSGKHVLTFNTLPEDHPTKAVAVDSQCVAIACRTGLKIFDTQGEFLRKLSDCPECPSSVARSRNDDLVVSDMIPNGSVLHIFSGTPLKLIHTIIGGSRAPCFERPWYITVDQENDILVADYHEHCVKIFNAFGGLLHEFGGKGCKPGQFFHPAGICVDKHQNILVADSCNDRVQLFTKSGELLGVILNGMEDSLCNPIDVDINPQGHLVVLQGDGQVRTFQYMW